MRISFQYAFMSLLIASSTLNSEGRTTRRTALASHPIRSDRFVFTGWEDNSSVWAEEILHQSSSSKTDHRKIYAPDGVPLNGWNPAAHPARANLSEESEGYPADAHIFLRTSLNIPKGMPTSVQMTADLSNVQEVIVNGGSIPPGPFYANGKSIPGWPTLKPYRLALCGSRAITRLSSC